MWSGKCRVGEMPVRENVQLGKCPSGKCPVGESSVRGNVRRESVSRGTVQSGNCPHTIYNIKVVSVDQKVLPYTPVLIAAMMSFQITKIWWIVHVK